ncbi:MAG: phospholipase D-like domain-containing protein [Candidatus Lokiarchaeia archaeon]
MSSNEKAEFKRDYKKAWKLAVDAIRLEELGRFEQASKNYVMSAEILYKLFGKPLKPELRNSIRNKCFEYKDRAELLRSISEKRRIERTDIKTETVSMVLHGPEIGLKAIEILRGAASEIMIMSYLLFDVKTIKGENKIHRVDLVDTLIQKSKDGVRIRIITSPPDIQFLGKNSWKQGNSIKKLLTGSSVEIKLCDFAHSKFIVADGLVVWRGSANLTSTGLSGQGDIAEITNDEYIVNYYYTIFEERWRKVNKSCQECGEKSCLKEYSILEQ